jgi:hypothetical protein
MSSVVALPKLPSVGRLLGRKVAAVVDRPAVWTAPHSWADADGLYVGHGRGWLYLELPLQLLRGTNPPLNGLLRELAVVAPGRSVHLVMHCWEERARVAEGTPAELAEYQMGAFTFTVPTRALLIGVKLRSSAQDSAAGGGVVPSLLSGIDELLAEGVPDRDAYDADRDALTAVLRGYRAAPASRSAAAHLESWYTLGSSVDVRATERDDHVYIDDASTVQVVGVTAVTAGGELRTHPSAGRRGASVVSVRGSLIGPRAGSTGPDQATGTLGRVSVIYGRRSSGGTAPLPVILRTLDGVETRPLPLRQLAGIDETMPCSDRTLNPSLHRLRGEHLQALGFVDPVTVGDDHGVFAGLAGDGFSQPMLLNPTEQSPVTLITGQAGAGKTFLAESVAVQAHLAGVRVIYLSTDVGGGQGLVDLVDAAVLDLSDPSALDPYRLCDVVSATELARAVTGAAGGTLSADERAGVDAGFRRAASLGRPGYPQAFGLADGVSGVSKVAAAVAAAPLLAPFFSTDEPDSLVLPRSCVVRLGTLVALHGERAAPGIAATALDLAVAVIVRHALSAPGPAGTLVVIDGAAGVLTGAYTTAAVAAVATANVRAPVAVWLATAETEVAAASAVTGSARRRFALAETAPAAADAAFALTGVTATEARRSWLAGCGPRVANDWVRRGALGLHLDAAGRRTSILIGPVPPAALPSLSRDAASTYGVPSLLD